MFSPDSFRFVSFVPASFLGTGSAPVPFAPPAGAPGRMLRDLRREQLDRDLRRSRALTRSPLGVAQLLVGCGLIR
jgi:hypothetical protein